MRKIAFMVVVSAAALTALTVACDSTPTRPSFLPPSSGPPPVSTTRIDIGGPGSVAPGQTAQFTATAHRSDGTTADITATANWRTSRPPVLTITPGGLATGVALGESNIQVTNQVTATREIVVLPAGTFRLVGFVAESDNPAIGVSGAQVEVVGAGPGLAVFTGQDGRYRLYGVPPTAEIRVTKAGYQPVTQTVSLSDNQTQNFALTLTTPRADFAGTYTLLISAADQCRDRLPQEVWTRRYGARVTQAGPLLDVSLTGGNFVVDAAGKGDGFQGRIEPTRVVFTINYGDFDYYRIWPDIVEELNPSLYLGVWGGVSAAVTPGNLSGNLNGTFFTVIRDPRSSNPAPNSTCNSALHQFVLQR